jgi:hypothetical protein
VKLTLLPSTGLIPTWIKDPNLFFFILFKDYFETETKVTGVRLDSWVTVATMKIKASKPQTSKDNNNLIIDEASYNGN